jgi:hypothetical protein
MENGWRNALLGIWVFLLIAAAGTATIGFWTQGQGQANDDADALGRAAVLLGAAGACASSMLLFLVLWIVVSAIVLEHEKDRRVWRGSRD